MGVNQFDKDDENIGIPILEIGPEAEQIQVKAVNELKSIRNETAVQQALYKIQETCVNGGNIMPPIIEASKVYVTLGEIVTAMKAEFGEWQEAAVF